MHGLRGLCSSASEFSSSSIPEGCSRQPSGEILPGSRESRGSARCSIGSTPTAQLGEPPSPTSATSATTPQQQTCGALALDGEGPSDEEEDDDSYEAQYLAGCDEYI